MDFLITYATWSLYALGCIVAFVTVANLLPSKKVWVRHCITTTDLEDVLKNGFRAPVGEQALINDLGYRRDELGQGGQDKVSFSLSEDKAYWRMRQAKKEINGESGELVYLYVKAPLKVSDGFFSKAVNVLQDGTALFHGYGIEVNIDRNLINNAIAFGDYSLERPTKYNCLWHAIVSSCAVVDGYILGLKILFRAYAELVGKGLRRLKDVLAYR